MTCPSVQMRSAAAAPGGPQADLAACIVAVATARDREAFAILFAHFAPRVKSYFSQHGANPVSAEDLAQETLFRVWQKAASFDPSRGAPAAWVFTVARNLRLDAMRRERRPENWEGLPDQPGSDHGAIRAQQERLLRRALNELPAEQLEVVRLSFFADMPHSEIGRYLGLPLGTVKSRIRRALSRLYLALK